MFMVTLSFSSAGLSMLSMLCHESLRAGMSEYVKEQEGAAVGLCLASSKGPNVSVSSAYIHTYVCLQFKLATLDKYVGKDGCATYIRMYLCTYMKQSHRLKYEVSVHDVLGVRWVGWVGRMVYWGWGGWGGWCTGCAVGGVGGEDGVLGVWWVGWVGRMVYWVCDGW